MPCPHCCSTKTTERSDRTAHGYRRFRCRGCGRGFNERTGSVLNRFLLPTDVVFLIVLWRLRMKLSLRDLAEILLLRGLVFSHEAIREWEARLAPLLTDARRRRRKSKAGRSWYVDETYIKVAGQWRYLYRAIDRCLRRAMGCLLHIPVCPPSHEIPVLPHFAWKTGFESVSQIFSPRLSILE